MRSASPSVSDVAYWGVLGFVCFGRGRGLVLLLSPFSFLFVYLLVSPSFFFHSFFALYITYSGLLFPFFLWFYINHTIVVPLYVLVS